MIIAFSNQKGGVGKTSLAATVWAALPHSLGIDLDSQGAFSAVVGGNEDYPQTSYNVLSGACKAKDAVQKLEKGDLICSSLDLDDLEDLSPLTLTKSLKSIKNKYQYIILDTPPVLNAITINALACADTLIIPTHGDNLSLRGLDRLINLVEVVRDEGNPNLKISGLVITRFNARAKFRQQMKELFKDFADSIGTKVFDATIRESVLVSEAQAMQQDIFTYAPKSKVAEDYTKFVSELKEVISNG